MAIKRGVILLSGGIDSVTTLYYALRKGYRLTALIFDYGQRHRKEIAFAKRNAQRNHVEYRIVKIPLQWTKSSLTDTSINIPFNRDLSKREIPLTYVAGRNIIFLSFAFSLAESIKAVAVFIGAHVHDYSGYPDCRPEFLRVFQQAVRYGLKNKGISIHAPLLYKTKREIVEMGNRLRVPFEDTWSCYTGRAYPCGVCDSCRFRVRAFQEAGVKDPLFLLRKNNHLVMEYER